jgi:tetratricopeptide (TPR) repeat protein
MARDEARTIKVRCTTWDQVEAFYTQKLKGDTLVVKMPVQPMIGDGVTVALGLPSGLVFAIDGSVTSVGAVDPSGKWPVAMKMHGLTKEVRERLDRLVHDGREGLLSTPQVLPSEPPPGPLAVGTQSRRPRPRSSPPPDGAEPVAVDPEPRVEDVIHDERPAFEALAGLHKQLLGLPAHEVLGVPFDADLATIRAGYFALARQHHPDAYGKYLSPALRRLASELFIYVNLAYDRLRQAAAAAGGARLPGPATRDGGGWLIDMRDVVEPPPSAPVEVYMAVSAPHPGPEDEPDDDTPTPRSVPAVAGGTPPAPLSAVGEAKDLASELFGDLPAEAAESQPFDAQDAPSTESALSLANTGRAAMAAGRWEEARSSFAAALKLDPRNRPVRALYHVASGMVLRQRGQAAEAQTQFETALGHDPQCADALRALGRLNDNQGIFRRVFDR